jgi:hypothetical protein
MGGFIPSTQRHYRRFFYYLLLLKLLHVSVVRPSSSINTFARIYSIDNGPVVFRIYLTLWITIVIGFVVGCFVEPGNGWFIPSTQRYYPRFFFSYLLLLKLLHVSFVRPSSGRNTFARIYSTDNKLSNRSL